MLVAYIDQRKSGSRNQVSPGARMVWMVTMKFSPVAMELKPAMKMPVIIAMTWPLAYVVRVGRVEGPAGIDAAGDDRDQARRRRRR